MHRLICNFHQSILKRCLSSARLAEFRFCEWAKYIMPKTLNFYRFLKFIRNKILKLCQTGSWKHPLKIYCEKFHINLGIIVWQQWKYSVVLVYWHFCEKNSKWRSNKIWWLFLKIRHFCRIILVYFLFYTHRYWDSRFFSFSMLL